MIATLEHSKEIPNTGCHITKILPQRTVKIKQLPITEHYIANFNELTWCTIVALPFRALPPVHGVIVDCGAFTAFQATFRGRRRSVQCKHCCCHHGMAPTVTRHGILGRCTVKLEEQETLYRLFQ